MSIDPMHSNGAASSGAGRIQQQGSQAAGGASTPASTSEQEFGQRVQADQVHLSDAAKDAAPATGTSASGLTSTKLREVLERLNSGFYDTGRVRDHVARQVLKDLDL